MAGTRNSRGEFKIHANVFDTFTNGIIFKLASQGLFDELKTALAMGKEANIFIATHGRESEKTEHLIVKIWRLENCNFKKMYEYLRYDPRYMHVKPSKRAIVFAWCQREYRNLLFAREAIRCPAPLGFKSNVLVMSLVGDAQHGDVARQLKDQAPQDPRHFIELILNDIKALWDAGLVHGDLSAFNILNDEENPVFIDFSQASPTNAPNAKMLLERDLTNISNHFKKLGVVINVETEKEKILEP